MFVKYLDVINKLISLSGICEIKFFGYLKSLSQLSLNVGPRKLRHDVYKLSMLTPTLMPFPSPLTHDKQMSSVPKVSAFTSLFVLFELSILTFSSLLQSKRPREDPSLNEHYYFLKEAVLSNAVVVHQPQMSALAASELIRKSKEFGKNPTKDRAIGQDDLMDSWSKEHGPLGSFLQLVDDFMSEMGPIGNKFMALNNGKLREKSFHTDKRFDPEPEYRIVCNYNDGEGEVGLIFRLKGTNVTFKILTPKGCALVFPRSFLTDEQFEHAHLGSGSCNFSVIYDFFACEAMLVGLTEVEIIAAAVNAVPFVQTFPEGGWTFFTGLWRKWYFGGGSIWRIAVGFIAGPSMGKGQRRNVPLKEARLIVSKMSVEERSKIASTAMSMRGELFFSYHLTPSLLTNHSPALLFSPSLSHYKLTSRSVSLTRNFEHCGSE